MDPEHLLTESNRNNDVVDTKLRISGDTVTVLKQWRPVVRPPVVRVVSPARGSDVKGTVTLGATASAARPAKVTAVQFLLDGLPLGGPCGRRPSSAPGRSAARQLARICSVRG